MRPQVALLIALFCCIANESLCDNSDYLKQLLKLNCDILTRKAADSPELTGAAAMSNMRLKSMGFQVPVESCTINGLVIKVKMLKDDGKFLQRQQCSITQNFNSTAECSTVNARVQQDCMKSMFPDMRCTSISGYVGTRETGVFVGVPLGLAVIGVAIGLTVFFVRKKRSNQMEHSALVMEA